MLITLLHKRSVDSSPDARGTRFNTSHESKKVRLIPGCPGNTLSEQGVWVLCCL